MGYEASNIEVAFTSKMYLQSIVEDFEMQALGVGGLAAASPNPFPPIRVWHMVGQYRGSCQTLYLTTRILLKNHFEIARFLPKISIKI